MTVGELINKLSQYPDDISVSVFGDDLFKGIVGGPHVDVGVDHVGVLCITGTYPFDSYDDDDDAKAKEDEINSGSKFISLDDACAVIRQLSDEDFNRLFVQLECQRRIESLQEITEKIRNYVTAFGSLWLENIDYEDGRVSFRDIVDAIGYEISHLERSVGE